jgi:glycosyltransferase involved in cell wall biosynthesis
MDYLDNGLARTLKGTFTMLISIAICTLNRAESLRRTLESLTTIRQPPDPWEVIVVNNGGTDHTDAVIEAFADRLPIRGECEPQRGLSHARNHAVLGAKGDYIVWTDDDVIVDRGWLAAYANAFRRHPDGAVFGGKIIERYLRPSPRWIRSFIGFAARDLGDAEVALTPDKPPYGANYAINTFAHKFFPYDPMIGPGTRRACEETDVIRRMLGAGAPGYWIPGAIVEHIVPPQRQTLKAILRYHTAIGEGDEYLCRRHHAKLVCQQ